MSSAETVLVTGASGFIATHCLLKLASMGYKLRGTVRDLERTSSLDNILINGLKKYYHSSTISVDWFAADLLSDDGWREACDGCDYVLHVASPVAITVKHEDELINPARNGTLRVLNAALAAKVKRAVITSSVSAITAGHPRDTRIFTEDVWSNTDTDACSPYEKSKTFAERDAWDFFASNGSNIELCTINPSLVFGPVLETDIGASVNLLREMFDGKYPFAPDLNFGIVDVRDVASLHVLAMTHPRANGNRFICNAETMPVLEISRILQSLYPNYTKRLPTRKAPNLLIKLLALFDPVMRAIVPNLDSPLEFDNSKAKDLLGWKPRPATEAIQDAAKSLMELPILKSL